MDALTLEDVVRKFDLRFDRIEQFLPTLATRTELQEGLQSVKDEVRVELATKAELQEGLQSVKDEMRAELATKAELQEGLRSVKTELRTQLREEWRNDMRAEIQAANEETRRYMKILVEELSDRISVFAEGLVALDARDARQHKELLMADASLDARVTTLENGRRRPRSR